MVRACSERCRITARKIANSAAILSSDGVYSVTKVAPKVASAASAAIISVRVSASVPLSVMTAIARLKASATTARAASEPRIPPS